LRVVAPCRPNRLIGTLAIRVSHVVVDATFGRNE
jgi:hypothetical protein